MAKVCEKCGCEIDGNSPICMNCGAAIHTSLLTDDAKEKIEKQKKICI